MTILAGEHLEKEKVDNLVNEFIADETKSTLVEQDQIYPNLLSIAIGSSIQNYSPVLRISSAYTYEQMSGYFTPDKSMPYAYSVVIENKKQIEAIRDYLNRVLENIEDNIDGDE